MRDFGRGNGGPRRSFDNRGGGFGGGERQSFKAVCADCGRECDLPFEPRGNRPVYCRDCFKNHPQEDRPQRSDSRDSRGGSRGDFRGDRRDSRGSDRPMFSAVCDNCGKTCQLPFEPRAGKPVYCSNCFEQKENGGPMPRRNERQDARPQSNAQMDAINAKLDKILNLLSNTKALKVEDPERSRRTSKVVEDEIAQLVKTVKAEKAIKPKKKAVKQDVRIVEPVAETPTVEEVATETELPVDAPKE